MKNKVNLLGLIIGLVILIIALVIIIIIAIKETFDNANFWISISCSLIASSIVIIITNLLPEKTKETPLDTWGLTNIYSSRKLMNIDCDTSMKNAKKQIDVIAFGLKSFRDEQTLLTKKLLKKGVQFRILTMNPESKFVEQREIEEEETIGHIKNSIEQLIIWANQLNTNEKRKGKGKIIVKGYDCMTLDFYWKVDDCIYTGPYLYHKDSQNTISYKYSKGIYYDMFSEYFETIWSDNNLTKILTNV